MKIRFGAIKIAVCVLALAFAVAAVAALTACGDDSSEHSLEKKSAVAATFFEGGSSEYYVCGDCGKYFSDADGKNEITEGSWVTPATGTTADVFDEFGTYDSGSEKGTKGIVCGLDTSVNAGPSTYFGEADKNLDWDGSKTTIAFSLDLSAMKENDFTIWVLAFNKADGDGYIHSGDCELRFGIAKTADGYVVNSLSGVGYNVESDRTAIITGGKKFTDSVIDASIEVAVDSENVMTYTMTVGGVEMSDDDYETEFKFSNKIAGFRYLWNAFMSGSGVEAYNFTRS